MLYGFLRYFYVRSMLLRRLWFFLKFIRRNKYWPDFNNPKTYNEKINFRKRRSAAGVFAVCADKIAVKDWVAERVGSEYIIPNYYVGDSISPEKIKEILSEYGDCLLKANHNSGPVQLLTVDSTEEQIKISCAKVNDQLKIDFGRLSDEPWYSKIRPRVLVEKRLDPEPGEREIRDYKFHVFKQLDGSYKIVLGVYFERGENITASFFDDDLNYLPFSYNYCSIKTSINKPKNYDKMLEVVKKLSSPFSYARVDLYNVGGQIYFGEITFADGSGSAAFSFYEYDLWMGKLWQGDPSL